MTNYHQIAPPRRLLCSGDAVRRLRNFASCLTVLCLLAASGRATAAAADVEARVARADIALGQPNVLATQAVGLGNGELGAAAWAADGLTLQLNRGDTLPLRRSPGQVVFPDLKRMTADTNFRGRLRLYDGVLEEAGGGVRVHLWVDRASDRVIVEIDGLPPTATQHVRLHLWPPRQPHANVSDDTAVLSEQWRDEGVPGASGQSFGSLAAVRVVGTHAHASVIDATSVEVTATPDASGHLRVIVAAPAFDGRTPASAMLQHPLSEPVDAAASVRAWHAFWQRAQLIEAGSGDGVASYAETLRTLYLFAAAAQSGSLRPGTQAGIADLFSSSADDHFWDPAAYWFWNQRMQLAANLAAGLPELNTAIFALYRNNLATLQQWTREHMGGRPGVCIPETMRFNGKGVEYENDRFRPFSIITHSCDLQWTPTSNARTLSTGAEIGLWVWRTYQQTDDRRFLADHYALMAESARFLLAYQRPGTDGLLHTAPSNAHETQMDVVDPATDLAAIRTLYPATMQAAHDLGVDASWTATLRDALARTPDLPQKAAGMHSDARVLAASHDVDAAYRNSENIGLEAVWPYAVIGADSALFAIAQRTFALRPFRYAATWSDDPVHAAYLGLGDEAANALFELIQRYQVYANGMSALLHDPPHEFYIEQAAVTALALSSMLAIEDSDGLVRVAPAIPSTWSMRGAVSLAHGAQVEVSAVEGRLTTFTLHVTRSGTVQMQTPWTDAFAHVWRDQRALPALAMQQGRLTLQVERDRSYRFALSDDARSPSFPTHTEASVKSLGRASIGLGEPCCAPPSPMPTSN